MDPGPRDSHPWEGRAMQTNPPRRPGELVFNLCMIAGSAFLLYSAYGISGFEALSAPGAVPMVASAIMLVCAALVLRETLRKGAVTGEKLERDILPMPVVVTVALIVGYVLLLQPLGFLTTSVVFLTAMIRYLAKASLLRSVVLAVLIVAVIYAIFRLIFTVLMPAGIVPEGEIIAAIKAILSGKGN